MRDRPDIRSFFALLLGVALVAGLSGCGAASDAGGASGGSNGDSSLPPEIEKAQSALADHRIDDARNHYRNALEADDQSGLAAAGLAITELLLLPGSQEMNGILRGHLGARDDFDAQTIIYDDEGVLYWLSRGAAWESQGRGDGIRQQVEPDLPWPDERLDSIERFFGPLDGSVGAARDDVVALADHLAEIEGHLETAVDDDDFDRIVIPGAALQESRVLTFKLGKSELSLLAGLVAGARGLLHYAVPYAYEWSLHTAFDQPCQALEQRRTHWDRADCTLRFLDGRMLREVAADPKHFERSREAFATSLAHLQETIRLGLEQRRAQDRGDVASTTLQWHKIDDPVFAKNLRALLGSFETALTSDSFTVLEGVKPNDGSETSANFAPLFGEGRTLPAELPWLVEDSYDDPSGYVETTRWIFNDEATQTFFVADLFDPPVDITDPDRQLVLELETGPNRQTDIEIFAEKLFSEFAQAVDDAYYESP